MLRGLGQLGRERGIVLVVSHIAALPRGQCTGPPQLPHCNTPPAASQGPAAKAKAPGGPRGTSGYLGVLMSI
jgi:hypothetical protein